MNDYDHDMAYVAREARILLGIITKLSESNFDTRLATVAPGMSRQQVGMLHMLHMHPHTISELSRKLLVDPSTLVPVADALERKGYLERGTDPNDRRRTPLLLTEEGLALLGRIPFADDNDVVVRSLRELGEDHTRQLLALLREMMRHMPDGEQILSEVGVRLQHFRQCQIARQQGVEPAADPVIEPVIEPAIDPISDELI